MTGLRRQSVSRLQMAELDCRAGRLERALYEVDRALSVETESLRALNLKISRFGDPTQRSIC